MVLFNYTIFLVTFLCMVYMGNSARSNYIIHDDSSSNANVVDVTELGALGNGKNDDSQAFLKAWAAVCGDVSGPTLLIPEGKTFLVQPIKFQGPCKSQKTHVMVKGVIIAPDKSVWSTSGKEPWLSFSNVNGLNVEGNGVIDGNGINWWKACANKGDGCIRPTALEFSNCNELRYSGLGHKDSQRNHISISSCANVVLSNLHINAPQDSPNTDGIDISHSTDVQINNCVIQTGDDCIAINDGSTKLNITSVSCGPGHGISIGSLGLNGQKQTVEDVYVAHCTFSSSSNGVRIKTWQGGSGYARNITFEDITFINTQNPIIIDQFYCPHATCKSSESAVAISEVWYTNIHGTSASEDAIALNCAKNIGCTKLTFNHINITSSDIKNSPVATCQNAHGIAVDAIPQIKCLLP